MDVGATCWRVAPLVMTNESISALRTAAWTAPAGSVESVETLHYLGHAALVSQQTKQSIEIQATFFMNEYRT